MADDGCLGNKTSCACKGIRTCLVCEVSDARAISKKQEEEERQEYFVCCNCGRTCLVGGARPRPLSLEPSCLSLECTNMSSLVVPDHLIGNEDIPFGGVTIVKNFISEKEEVELVSLIDSVQWAESQSGRRKQDYGPRVNFKKQKIKMGAFFGLPRYTHSLLERLETLSITSHFKPVELCNLDYNPKRGSSIDPHFDDDWLWGQRLVTLNLVSSTLLSFGHPVHQVSVHVPHPRHSLVIVEGLARYNWLHGIRRENVRERRVAMTFRELSREFSPGGEQEEIGGKLLSIASNLI